MDFSSFTNQYNSKKNPNESNVLTDFQKQVSRKDNNGSPSFSSSPGEPVDLQQYLNPSDQIARDKRPLQERLQEARNKTSSPNTSSVLADVTKRYRGQEDDDNGEIDYTKALDGTSLRPDQIKKAASIFKSPTEQNSNGLNTAIDSLTNTAEQLDGIPEIASSGEYAFGGADAIDSSTIYSDLNGVEQGLGEAGKVSKGWQGTGSTASGVVGVAGFAAQIAQAYSTESDSEANSFQQGGSLILSGATAGLAIAGPWGAAIGGTVGTVVAISDHLGDRKRRGAREEKSFSDKANKIKDRRMRDYLGKKNEKRNDALMSYHQAQLGYIDLNNY